MLLCDVLRGRSTLKQPSEGARRAPECRIRLSASVGKAPRAGELTSRKVGNGRRSGVSACMVTSAERKWTVVTCALRKGELIKTQEK
jgi:hypothetical protein